MKLWIPPGACLACKSSWQVSVAGSRLLRALVDALFETPCTVERERYSLLFLFASVHWWLLSLYFAHVMGEGQWKSVRSRRQNVPTHEPFCSPFCSPMILVQWMLLATLAATGLPCVLCIFELATFANIRKAHRGSVLSHFWITADISL